MRPDDGAAAQGAWSDDRIRRYLLGEASAPEREAVEQRYMHDDAALESLLCAEAELIDAYLQGALSASDQARFESHFLVSDRRRRRLRFARDVRSLAGSQRRRASTPLPAPTRGGRQAWRGAAALFAATAAVWAVSRPLPHRGAPAGAGEGDEASGVVAVHVLQGGSTRAAGGAVSIRLPEAAGRIELQLPLDVGMEFTRHRVRLEDRSGRLIWMSDALKSARVAGRWLVAARIPTAVLSSGDYVLRLLGIRDDGGEEAFEEYLVRLRRE